jgi:Tat protein translocase TatB subunit
MLFFIGESIGWQELLLIGMFALIFLGPRKLPRVAKTLGKAIAELRRAGQEFKKTWEKEIALEEEEKRFLQNPLDENLILAEEKYSKVEYQDDLSKLKNDIPPGIEIVAKSPSSRGVFVKKIETANKDEAESTDALEKNEISMINGKQNWL